MFGAAAPEPGPKLTSPRLSPGGLIAACAAVLFFATLAGFLGGAWWMLDLFSHFRVQYFAGSAALCLVSVLGHRKRLAAWLAAVALLNLGTILPLYFRTPQPDTQRAETYCAVLMNVNTADGDPSKVAQVIRELRPDLLVLEEVSDVWIQELGGILKAFPHSVVSPRDDNFGIALYSSHPFGRNEIRTVGEADLPSVIADVELPTAAITVIATHPLPPSGAENARLRNDQLRQLARLAKEAHAPVLILGDLNTTPWSSHFRRLLKDSGLQDSSQGRGPTATWPTFLPALLIPLDHCLHSEPIQVSGKRRGPNVGSDHYPLVVDFQVGRPKEPARARPSKAVNPSLREVTLPLSDEEFRAVLQSSESRDHVELLNESSDYRSSLQRLNTTVLTFVE